MRWWLVCLTAIGCTDPELRVEPPALDLDVDLAKPAPSVDLRVFADGEDVTAQATFALAGTPIGTLAGARLASDGRTGGAAAITVTFGDTAASVPVAATIRERRLVAGTPADAPAWFVVGQELAVVQPLEPGDGATLPPGLGKLEVDFGAADGDNLHDNRGRRALPRSPRLRTGRRGAAPHRARR